MESKEYLPQLRKLIKTRLNDLDVYVDEELIDYITVLLINKKSAKQMIDDLSLFLSEHTENFVKWLFKTCEKLQSANYVELENMVDKNKKDRKSESSMKHDKDERKITSRKKDEDSYRHHKHQIEDKSYTSQKEKYRHNIKRHRSRSRDSIEYDDKYDTKRKRNKKSPKKLSDNSNSEKQIEEKEKVFEPMQFKNEIQNSHEDHIIPNHVLQTENNVLQTGNNLLQVKNSLQAEKNVQIHESKDIATNVNSTNHSQETPIIQSAIIKVFKEKEKSKPSNELFMKAIKDLDLRYKLKGHTSPTKLPLTLEDVKRSRTIPNSQLFPGHQMVNDTTFNSSPPPPSKVYSPIKVNFDETMNVEVTESPFYDDENNDEFENKTFDPITPQLLNSIISSQQRPQETKFIVTLNHPSPQHHYVNSISPVVFDKSMEFGRRSDDRYETENFKRSKGSVHNRLVLPSNTLLNDESAGRMSSTSIFNRLGNLNTQTEEGDVEMELSPNGEGHIKERCKFWPACKNGDKCIFHHPTLPCKTFPNCTFGDKCLFIHPNCKYDAHCTKKDCPFTHASVRKDLMISLNNKPPAYLGAPFKTSSTTPLSFNKTSNFVFPSTTQTSSAKPCKFGPVCFNPACAFLHPPECKFGSSCNRMDCPFKHQAQTSTLSSTNPVKSKTKWINPNLSSVKLDNTGVTSNLIHAVSTTNEKSSNTFTATSQLSSSTQQNFTNNFAQPTIVLNDLLSKA